MARKHSTTTIEENIKKAFAKKCDEQGYKQNDVLEKLMEMYSEGKIVFTKKTGFDVEVK